MSYAHNGPQDEHADPRPSPDLLDDDKWIFLKIYRGPSVQHDWKSQLDWYHEILIAIIRPAVESMPDITLVFFGIYGPTPYENEKERYDRQIKAPSSDVTFIRLRLSVPMSGKTAVTEKFVNLLETNGNLIGDYELMTTYHVRDDLGKRFGSGNDEQTLRFTRYWDSAYRYILSILASPRNWAQNVDVWGIPHMVNNSLGAYLRLGTKSTCCHESLYMATEAAFDRSIKLSSDHFPLLVVFCPRCGSHYFLPTNI